MTHKSLKTDEPPFFTFCSQWNSNYRL